MIKQPTANTAAQNWAKGSAIFAIIAAIGAWVSYNQLQTFEREAFPVLLTIIVVFNLYHILSTTDALIGKIFGASIDGICLCFLLLSFFGISSFPDAMVFVAILQGLNFALTNWNKNP